MPQKGDIAYSTDLELDLASVRPSVAGPKRPQDKIELAALKEEFRRPFPSPRRKTDSARRPGSWRALFRFAGPGRSGDGSQVRHGDVLIAAITSCTNTSNPSVMLAAGLLAKKAVESGTEANPLVKASLAPGSRVVTGLFDKDGSATLSRPARLQPGGLRLHDVHRQLGPLAGPVEEAVVKNDVIAAAVLSGNRNFEARVHQNIKANFLMSPPLVVAFALAGG